MNRKWIAPLLLAVILLGAGYLRLVGIDWDEGQHLHPDERFLTDVLTRISSVDSLGTFFDTASSSLNPGNHGLTFFVYGTLPIFVTRYAAEWVEMTGFDQVHLVGRALSAMADLGIVLLVYLMASRLFDKRVGLLAAAFSAVSVLQIQQSHFFTVDNFTNFFAYLAVFFALRIAKPDPIDVDEEKPQRFLLADFLLFGFALGLAVSSKLSIAPLAIVLPAALALRIWKFGPDDRAEWFGKTVWYLFFAGLISFITFRIFQPYAFEGPGLLNLNLNPQWVDTMRSLRAQISGDVDWPPSMQWARRPIWFAFSNLSTWGLGLPLGTAAWTGFAWAGWRIYKAKWQRPEVILWGWAGAYFVWQSIAFNPTMRYFLPVYPALVIFAAMLLVQLWDGKVISFKGTEKWRDYVRPAAGVLGSVVLVASAIYAIAFASIYQRSVTRVEAARWIYQNVPGPITLHLEGADGNFNQPLPVPSQFLIDEERPYLTSVRARIAGQLEAIALGQIIAPVRFEVRSEQDEVAVLLHSENQIVDLLGMDVGEREDIVFSLPLGLVGLHRFDILLPEGEGQVLIEVAELGNSQNPTAPGVALSAENETVSLGQNIVIQFELDESFVADELRITLRTMSSLQLAPIDVRMLVSNSPDMNNPLAEANTEVQAKSASGGVIDSSVFHFESPLELAENQEIYLQIEVAGESAFQLLGSAVVNETSWDDGLPLRIDGYDGFGGIYQGGLNHEIYWDEDATKLERFLGNLEAGEYLFISSSRQWASLPRIPERFPLASAYYRLLMGCPDEASIEDCYNQAQLGSYEGRLGFELVQVFESSPQIGSLIINDQPSEEAFTVYDHPKVFIFQKSADYEQEGVRELLSAVDLTRVERVTPKQASGQAAPSLMLPETRWAEQRAGGTWAELFDTENWVNASPWVSVVVWYVVLGLLGVAVFPLLRVAMPGLDDSAYPFGRVAALLLLSYGAWLGASLGLTFSQYWLAIFAGLIVLVGAVLAYRQRAELLTYWESKRHLIYRTELLFLGFFLLMLLIRWGNPDLWHPGKGGEKPMDFSYFNAVLKSSSFPPYDPWFAGGYINYYYYGFVLVGSLTKLLGIVPAVAYNLILPTLFAMVALGAYSIVWNLFSAWRDRAGGKGVVSATLPALSASIGLVALGNLGSLQMIFQGYQRLGSPGTVEGGVLERIGWTMRGFVMNIQGASLPFGVGDWYWNPTRIIPAPGETVPITEFPLFTFTYADLHAHMIALPLTLLALAWALSLVLSRAWEGQRSLANVGWSLLFGGIVIGSLRATNTWDFPTYLAIGALTVVYAVWRYAPAKRGKKNSFWMPTWLAAIGGAAALVGLSFLSFKPYADWYAQGFSSMEIWRGTHTPSNIYLLHWGVFLFFIFAWMAWETRQWLANTPISALKELEKFRPLIFGAAALMLAIIAWLSILGIAVWWVLPLMVWAGLLMLRPGQSEAKRIILFLIGTGLFLTLMVEVIRLSGDISRMNTVFKFYMQVWTLFAISAGLSLAWVLTDLAEWSQAWKKSWQTLGVALVTSAGLFMLLGVSAKIKDRMVFDSAGGLDGMAYMQEAVYYDRDQELVLNQDYEAIRWLQENVQGSPVIVEAHTGEYRWGSRITINTGLPTVLGWNWHQRQQREFVPGNDVWGRVAEIQLFYEGVDLNLAKSFLEKYEVEYIVVGQLEQAYYPVEGIEKFAASEGIYWREVFRFEDMVIYQVIDDDVAAQ
jgi:YYY domain-containing protein